MLHNWRANSPVASVRWTLPCTWNTFYRPPYLGWQYQLTNMFLAWNHQPLVYLGHEVPAINYIQGLQGSWPSIINLHQQFEYFPKKWNPPVFCKTDCSALKGLPNLNFADHFWGALGLGKTSRGFRVHFRHGNLIRGYIMWRDGWMDGRMDGWLMR